MGLRGDGWLSDLLWVFENTARRSSETARSLAACRQLGNRTLALDSIDWYFG